MKRIGLLSDTHGTYDAKYADFFKDCDEIWHAGDIGSLELCKQLEAIAPLRAVYGNIDGHDIRMEYPQFQIFKCEHVLVMITHIGGYPNRYAPLAKELIIKHQPQLFITGHSHILKVINDPKYHLLHINPGAAGIQGFHQVRTLLRFVINNKNIQDLEILEMHNN